MATLRMVVCNQDDVSFGDNMRNIILALTTHSLAQNAMAAPPRGIQNMKHLDVMVAYIREHPEVTATLTAIDLQGRTV